MTASRPRYSELPMRHEVFDLMDNVLDDRLDNFFPQGSTQWDGFGHFAHPTKGFFGGPTAGRPRPRRHRLTPQRPRDQVTPGFSAR